MTRLSYQENGDGYILTTALMRWFWDHYADPADRGDPRAAPLRGDLQGLPPTCIVAADFDPLRTPWRPRGYRSASSGPADTPTRR